MLRVYAVEPVPAPRQVRSDAWNPSDGVCRYRAYRDWLQWHRAVIPLPFHHAVFVLPMPPSWPKEKRARMHGQPHTNKPDRDNLEKALLDSALASNDAHVWNGQTTKLWGTRGLVIVSDTPLPIAPPVNLEPYYSAVRCNPVGDVIETGDHAHTRTSASAA